MSGMGVGHQQGASLPRGPGCELVAVDEAHPLIDGVDTEPGPSHVEKRQCRYQLDLEPLIGPQPADRFLQHQG